MEPLVSVIVPVYKTEAYLGACVDSLLGQSYQRLEILLVDDGSPDRCGEICDEYAARDRRVRVIHQENAGVSAARNAALDRAEGELIGFVDSDDWVEQDWAESLVRALDGRGADIAVCGWLRHEAERTIDCSAQVGTDFLTADEAFCSALRGGIEGFGCNKLFRAGAIGAHRFREDLGICEDLLFVEEVIAGSSGAVCVPRGLYHYRIHGASALHDLDKRLAHEQKARLALLALAEGHEKREDAAVFSYVQQMHLNAVRAKKAGRDETAGTIRAALRPYVGRALAAGSIGAADRAKLALKLVFPALIAEKYL